MRKISNARLQRKIDKALKFDHLKRNPYSGPGGRRGLKNEKRALEIAKTLIASENLIGLHPRHELRLSLPFSPKDMQGYDIVFPTDRGEFGIQIKSSTKSRSRFFKKRPGIPCIVVNEHVSDESITNELRTLISQEYSKL